jgi:hypothetical protein
LLVLEFEALHQPYFVIFFSALGFELWASHLLSGVLTTWVTPPTLVMDFFEIGSYGTICPGWLWTVILLISASWVVRITVMSHQHLAPAFTLEPLVFILNIEAKRYC